MSTAPATLVQDPTPDLLGQRLIAAGHISAEELDRGLDLQSRIGGRLGSILIRLGALSEEILLDALAEQLQLARFEPGQLPKSLDETVTWLREAGTSVDWWLEREALAWADGEGRLLCIARDLFDVPLNELLAEQAGAHGLQAHYLLARSHDLESALAALEPYRLAAEDRDDQRSLRELAEEAPTIEFVNNLIAQAAEQRASDIHLEPGEQDTIIRFRIDGVLYRRFQISPERARPVISRIKLIADTDIAERRLPQDGRIRTRVSGHSLDIRVSVVPGKDGESIVMRLLPVEQQGHISLQGLGFTDDQQSMLKRWLIQPNGIVLVTGPTGSGKSTTLYGGLDYLNDESRKIITVEDPVEYRISGIVQVQTLREIDYTFARALRAFLRHDPDVIMVGEIRDLETAQIAVQAALTGHLVLSTLHTNDAVSSFTRLVDMGLEPFLVAAPMRGVLAQRLVRRVCPDCSVPLDGPPAHRALPPDLALPADAQWRQAGPGCATCRNTGYSGRLALFEMVDVSDPLRRAIAAGEGENRLHALAREQGMQSLFEDGLAKAARGLTTVDEVLRVAAVAAP